MKRTLLVLLCALIATELLPSAQAATPKVNDQAGFFSKEAVDAANKKLDDIYRRYKVEVLIETFPAIPDDKKADYKPEDKKSFFRHWAETRATDQGVKGIYMLVCKDPAYLYMQPDEAVRKKAFTLDDRTALVAKVRGLMHKKQYDDALKETADSISTTIAGSGVSEGSTK